MATAADSTFPNESTDKALKTENEMPSTSKPQKEKKIGHRRVDAATGLTTYKKTPASALSRAIQLGISHTVGGINSKPERDVLLQDFQVVETTLFPAEGSNITPAHHYDDFRFKTYAPVAFRYFRDLFGILPADFMLSISAEPLTELSNPGASGSLFFVTHDDEFIIKTVQHKEAEFLQKLLPGYYMNLVQNPRTLLPKFYGLYCIQAGGKNIRMVVMNNLLPRHLKMHLKYDLKGSTFKRKASKHEREKRSPTFKDLDIVADMPDGILLESDIHAALMKTLQRDCLVLRSFKIMDYSLLLGIHYVDKDKEDRSSQVETSQEKRKSNTSDSSDTTTELEALRRPVSKRRDPANRNTPTDSIMSATLLRDKYTNDLELWSGGIPAKSPKGERLLLFCGLIDILQCYKLKKKLEHTFKSVLYDADSVSVHRPGFYCDRFQKFMSENVFKKAAAPIKAQPTKRRGQLTRRDGFGSGAMTAPVTSSPMTRSKMSPAHSGGKKLQSDRPDLLPSESPRPTYDDSQEEENDSTIRHYVVSQTPPRMQIRMEDRSPGYNTAESSKGSNYQNASNQQMPRTTNFSVHSNEAESGSASGHNGPGTSGMSQSRQSIKVDQVNLQWNERSPVKEKPSAVKSDVHSDLQNNTSQSGVIQTTSFNYPADETADSGLSEPTVEVKTTHKDSISAEMDAENPAL